MTTKVSAPSGAPALPLGPLRRAAASAAAVRSSYTGIRDVAAAQARQHRHWVPLLLAYLLAWAVPVTWCWRLWGDPNNPLSFQPLVPLGVGLLVWARRADVRRATRRLNLVSTAESAQRKPGDLRLVIAGCLLLLFAFLTQVSGIAVLGLLLMGAGIALAVFGRFLLQVLGIPLLFSLTMVPLPDSLVGMMTQTLQLGSTQVAGLALQKLRVPCEAVGTFLKMPNYTLEVAVPCSGMSILFPVLALTLWLLLWRRAEARPMYGACLLCAAGVVALLMNVLRIVLMGLIGAKNPQLAQTLHDANSWLFTALAFYLTFLLARVTGIDAVGGAAADRQKVKVRT